MDDATTLNQLLERSRERWKQHPFYASDAVVLGLDIGIEGIGICVRVGTKVIYCRSLLVNLPQAQALAGRRQLRAARHARKNYRTRMSRLRRLFERHGLPWVSDEVYSRSDAYLLRYRALCGARPLASKEALSLCIRSAVARRGYDYFAMCREGNDYPWGDSLVVVDALKWLSSAFVDEKMRTFLLGMEAALTNKKGDELSEAERERWRREVETAYAKQQERGLDALLEAYAKKKLYERKARGANFPRAHVEAHLRRILERHRHLIEDAAGFEAALFLPNDTKRHKKQAIFHYNRKTPDEAMRHIEKKVKSCPYCEALELPPQPCGMAGDPDIRIWKLLDFLANRRLEFKHGKLTYKNTLPAAGVAAMVEALREGAKQWSPIKERLLAAIAPVKIATGEWNKAQLEQLKDICVSPGTRARAGMSVAAARTLVHKVTQGGTCYEPEAMEAARKELGLYQLRAAMAAAGGIYPQVRALLGMVKSRSGRQSFVTTGELQRLFRLLAPELPAGKKLPDYVVIECVKGAPLDSRQKKEFEEKQKQNRAKKQKRAEKLGLQKMTRSTAYRLCLFEEQGGSIGKSPAICPFTGRELGCDPLSSDLELAHLYPDSRGGLYVAENLVLTTRSVNQDMGNRTPREAAAAGLPGWMSWETICKGLKAFDWSENKRNFFLFEPNEERSFPDFNNLTRTAQLAAELRNLTALWLGISGDSEAVRVRIGNPSGTYTAAARRCWLGADYEKDRSTTTHHRLDALVMSCIPPGEGINDVRYGGIFYTEKKPDARGKEQRRLVSLTDLPMPDIEAMQRDAAECPVVKARSHSKYASLGDSTFWSVDEHGKTHQRAVLTIDKKTTVASLLQTFADMKIPGKYMPKESAVARWLEAQTPATQGEEISAAPLRLRGGTPIKSIHKFASKGNVDKSPMGWNGRITPSGKFDQLRKLDGANERLELWIGWNPKKKRWEYQTRVIPTRQALQGIKRMGLPWRGRQNAPGYLVALLERMEAPDLRTLVCGSLWPHSLHLADIRKGDVFLLNFPAAKSENDVSSLPICTWGEVTALLSSGQIEIKALTHKDRSPAKPASPSVLAAMLTLPGDAAVYAQEHCLTPPS